LADVQRGGIVWLTGLSGAGQSTLARALAAKLAEQRPVELLDGDEARAFLSSDLGSSREARDASVQRIAYVARLLARHGALVIVAAIAPYAAMREDLKRRSEAEGHPFVEVHVDAPLVPGGADPYEPSTEPVLEVRTDRESPTQSETKILRVLARLGLV
jgi:adenylylsulfate kinase